MTDATFRPELPANCPPDTATQGAIGQAWRLVSSAAPSEQDFLSHVALGSPYPQSNACKFASCSMFASREGVVANWKRWPKLRAKKTHAALVNIDETLGAYETNGSHIDYWAFAGVTLSSYVIDVVELAA